MLGLKEGPTADFAKKTPPSDWGAASWGSGGRKYSCLIWWGGDGWGKRKKLPSARDRGESLRTLVVNAERDKARGRNHPVRSIAQRESLKKKKTLRGKETMDFISFYRKKKITQQTGRGGKRDKGRERVRSPSGTRSFLNISRKGMECRPPAEGSSPAAVEWGRGGVLRTGQEKKKPQNAAGR